MQHAHIKSLAAAERQLIINSYLLVLGLRDSSRLISACSAFAFSSVVSPGLRLQSSQGCLVAVPAVRHSIESVLGMYLTSPINSKCYLSFSTAATFGIL